MRDTLARSALRIQIIGRGNRVYHLHHGNANPSALKRRQFFLRVFRQAYPHFLYYTIKYFQGYATLLVMKTNKSPWIRQLDTERETKKLSSDLTTDVVIVGAGIAGVSTAFFILKHTPHKVTLLDRGLLAHGATGHNAGQVVARFERPLADMVKEFGFEKTAAALHELNTGWELLSEIYTDANLNILFSRVPGKRGFSDLDQFLAACADMEIEVRAQLPNSEFLVSETAPFRDAIPEQYTPLYRLTPQKDILKLLETESANYHAVAIDQAAFINSALFCQEIARFLLEKYRERFALYEHTHIRKVVLKKNHALLDAETHTITADRCVLCTNGFENIEILNEGGLEIEKRFHHEVEGVVGYMSGYLETLNKPPTAIAYFQHDSDPTVDDPYFYLTRRPHDIAGKNGKHNLICVGGPELVIRDREEYLSDYDYPEKMHTDIDAFIKNTYDTNPNKKIDYEFTWHGLMGYTPSRVRIVGAEPRNPVLLYNIGCNGIGILPSIFGGRRIARLIAGETLSPSIFDPRAS